MVIVDHVILAYIVGNMSFIKATSIWMAIGDEQGRRIMVKWMFDGSK